MTIYFFSTIRFELGLRPVSLNKTTETEGGGKTIQNSQEKKKVKTSSVLIFLHSLIC